MKEKEIGFLATNLQDTALALASILDQPVEKGCIKVNFQFASQLVCWMKMAAKSAADELLLIEEERKEAGL